MEKLFYILKQKGSITADEYDLLIATMKARSGQSRSEKPPPASSSAPGADRIEGREPRIDAPKHQVARWKSSPDQRQHLPLHDEQDRPRRLLSDKWYERIKLRGYIQNRFIGIIGDDDTPGYNQANDSLRQ
jgi:hypothetical protein